MNARKAIRTVSVCIMLGTTILGVLYILFCNYIKNKLAYDNRIVLRHRLKEVKAYGFFENSWASVFSLNEPISHKDTVDILRKTGFTSSVPPWWFLDAYSNEYMIWFDGTHFIALSSGYDGRFGTDDDQQEKIEVSGLLVDR